MGPEAALFPQGPSARVTGRFRDSRHERYGHCLASASLCCVTCTTATPAPCGRYCPPRPRSRDRPSPPSPRRGAGFLPDSALPTSCSCALRYMLAVSHSEKPFNFRSTVTIRHSTNRKITVFEQDQWPFFSDSFLFSTMTAERVETPPPTSLPRAPLPRGPRSSRCSRVS